MAAFGEIPNVHVASHPLIGHKMTFLRDVTTEPHEFRRILKELTFFIGVDATRNINTKTVQVKTPMDLNCDCQKISDDVAIIPVCKYHQYFILYLKESILKFRL